MNKRLASLIIVLAFVLSACTLTEGKEYRVYPGVGDGGPALYLEIKKPTNDLIADVLWAQVCHMDHRCTANWLIDNSHISGWGAAEWYGALRDKPLEFGGTVHGVWLSSRGGEGHHVLALTLRRNWNGTLDWRKIFY